jgi:hypothetical protein
MGGMGNMGGMDNMAGMGNMGGMMEGGFGGMDGGVGGWGGAETGGTLNTAGTSAGGTSGATSAGGTSGATAGGGTAGTTGAGGTSGGTGAGGTSGTGGGGTNAGGTAGVSGGGASAGTAGTAGSGSPPCGGCAVLSAPVTAANSAQAVQLWYFGTPVDLTGAKLTIRVRSPGAQSGGFQVYAEDTGGHADYSFWKNLNSLSTFTDVVYTIPAASPSYDPSKINAITFQIAAGATGPWAAPTVLEIDSITVTEGTGTLPGPYTFDTKVDPLHLGTYNPITGSTLTWKE